MTGACSAHLTVSLRISLNCTPDYIFWGDVPFAAKFENESVIRSFSIVTLVDGSKATVTCPALSRIRVQRSIPLGRSKPRTKERKL
ncbi:MAG: hypothetical protein ACI87W_001115 [Halieaceae bacterium]